jgi:hypothetical protein
VGKKMKEGSDRALEVKERWIGRNSAMEARRKE